LEDRRPIQGDSIAARRKMAGMIRSRSAPSARLAAILLSGALLGACGADTTPKQSPDPQTSAPSDSATVAPSSPPRATPAASEPVAPTPSPSTAPSPFIACAGSAVSGPGNATRDRSRAWSGYLVTKPDGRVTCIEGGWVEPVVACPPKGAPRMSIWVGIDGVKSTSLGVDALQPLIQIGTQVDCDAGLATHFGWHEVYPVDPHVVSFDSPLTAGDRMRAQVAFRNGTFVLTLLNLTTGTKDTIVQRAVDASRATAEWTVEAPSIGCPDACKPADLPDFEPIRVTDARVTIDGHLGGIRGPWTWDATDMVRNRATIASTGDLFSTGDSFRVTQGPETRGR
jgi:hypothetical protein